ncbi:MAG: hypothetical protein OZ921_15360 [Sorangiineae bacterium]|nr:hypothetical protein [Polyangiaceae bacterium]MEB2323889.1 hypothetical protein [Sorangiineae bacterium]
MSTDLRFRAVLTAVREVREDVRRLSFATDGDAPLDALARAGELEQVEAELVTARDAFDAEPEIATAAE